MFEGHLDAIDLTDLDRFTSGFPHPVFARLRRDAPVWFHEPTEHTPGGEGFWVLSRHADITAVAADTATYSSDGSTIRPTGGGTLIEDLPGGFAAGVLLNMMDDPRHQRIRRLIMPTVGPRALARAEVGLRAIAEDLVGAVVERGTVDFLVDVALELPLQAVADLLGVPRADRHTLFGWANVNLDLDDHDLGESTARTAEASAAMFGYATELIEERRRCPGEDLMSIVATAAIPGGPPDDPGPAEPLGDLEAQMFFNLLIAAGSETTRNSVAGGILALCDHPDQWAALRADRSLLPTAVEEVLRYTSTTAYNRRTALVDTTLGDHRIAAGDKVTLWWPSANHDEAVFTAPHRFDVARDEGRHLAFGHGGHFCLGAQLARLEIRLLLEALLDRVATLELAGPPEWTRSNKHTGLRHLPVALTPAP